VDVGALRKRVSLLDARSKMWTMVYWLVDQLTPGGAFAFNTNTANPSVNGLNAFTLVLSH
jgi:hypothetical protein